MYKDTRYQLIDAYVAFHNKKQSFAGNSPERGNDLTLATPRPLRGFMFPPSLTPLPLA